MPSRKNRYSLITLMMSFMLVVSFHGFGQYLNELCITDTVHEYTENYNTEGAFLTSVSCVQDSNWNWYGWNFVEFKRYDQAFNVISKTRYTDSLHAYQWGKDLTHLQDAYFFPGYQKGLYLAGDPEGLLFKFDSLGNLIWKKTLFPSVEQVQPKFCISKNDKLYVAGAMYHPSTSGVLETFLSELDTAGNILWTQYFTGNQQQPLSLKNTSDGGFILSTSYFVGGTNHQTRVYKLDNAGGIDWQQTVGGSTEQHQLGVTEIPNGNFLGIGGSQSPLTTAFRTWLVKFDDAGNVLKDTVQDYSNGFDGLGGFISPIFKGDGFYAVGGIYEDAASTMYESYWVKYDYSFNMMWMRRFYVRNEFNFITYQTELDNNFVLLAGCAWQDSPSNTADEWFIVLDSMGCDVVNCAIGVKELQSDNLDMSIYPNPTDGDVNVVIEGFDGSKDVVIFDMLGNEIDRISLTDEKTSISLENLDSGMYIFELIEDGASVYSKWVMKR